VTIVELSRRKFIHWAASTSTFALAGPGMRTTSFLVDADDRGFRAKLMPGRDQIWAWQVWMNELGPKFTGNRAHRAYVDFLDEQLQATGLETVRDQVKFPRWEARRWELSATPASGTPVQIPVTSFFPYSGQTSAVGVTGELIYAENYSTRGLSQNVQGKIVLVDCRVLPHPFQEWYSVWGTYPQDTIFPSTLSRMTQISVSSLSDFQKAGALGVVLAWTDVSDANAAGQYTPFTKPLQNIPGLRVGREAGAKLRSLASSGAKATMILEADITPDSPTDHLLATLPGMSSDEILVVNTHTDGPNAMEENGGIGILALANYFARIPKNQRKRTIVFIMATGHFALAYVPSIAGVIAKHPDLIQKAVGALTIEHLGAMEWLDDAAFNYGPTGQHELSLAIAPLKSVAQIMLDCLQESGDTRTAVINPVKGGLVGEGAGLSRAGVPTVGYIPIPNYILAAEPDGCISKLSPDLMAAQIKVFAKVIHQMDGMTAAQLKGL
jgi:hypothetical protein